MNNKLITIATFGNSVEASLAKQLLEAEGIPAFIMDDDTASMAWHLTIALGWIKLKVLQSDVDNAVDILTAVDLIESYNEAPSTSENIPSSETVRRHSSSTNSKSDKILDDAFNAAIIGLFLFPLCVMQLYSLLLLVFLIFTGWKISANRQLKAAVTFLLNLLMITVTWMLITALV
ncbi:hypothetical protein NIES4071_76030 [Calothrix sp. NIES-4071]|nr:hypothetical protein NIES4071_76030 [Calothrix sp. NIES-4071]BAZ61878.1 hypothetical protein NIES4105_75980 [Calothrix sp. NIES-4105]